MFVVCNMYSIGDVRAGGQACAGGCDHVYCIGDVRAGGQACAGGCDRELQERAPHHPAYVLHYGERQVQQRMSS